MKTVLLIMLTNLLLISCDMGSKSNKKSNTPDNSNPQVNPTATNNPTNPPINTSCFASGVGTSSTEYFKLDLVGKGWSDPNYVGWRASDYPTNHGYNASETQYYLDTLRTDGRYNMRILALSSPGKTADEYGNACVNLARPYTKLRMKIRIRAIGSGFTQDHTFISSVGSCSEVYEFSVPATVNPIDVEVLSVNWDYDCIQYLQRGCGSNENDPGCAGACPYRFVNERSCYSMQIQLATSYTKDIPH